MKNIIILGAARSGKSTLSEILHEKYNYSIISIDSFVSAIQDNFLELGITHSNTENKFKLLAPFVYSYMKKIINEYPNQKFVLEGWHVYPKDILHLFKKEDIKIVCLGYTKINIDEAFSLLRANETENSYTKRMTDEKVRSLIEKHMNYSVILKEQCVDNKIMFFDTSVNREKILDDIVKYLME